MFAVVQSAAKGFYLGIQLAENVLAREAWNVLAMVIFVVFYS